jgi:PTH1 family peptidyl-tRNA hydrolase
LPFESAARHEALPPVEPFRLIVGLGNPGREYADTRHNVGFMLVDRLTTRARAEWRRERGWQAEMARAGTVHLCKPLTYMNLSGQSVRAVADFYKIAPSEMLIVLDDFALPLGKLRFRPEGSGGGHNGLKSVIEHLGTQSVPRLRVGIGSATAEVVDYVLGRFTLAEREPLEQSLQRAEEAVIFAQDRGLAAAMNTFN